MPRVIYVHPNGQPQSVAAEPGESVMRVAISHGVTGIIGECGGELTCATCHVFVDPDWVGRLSPISETEEVMLEVSSEEPTAYSRLCCQIVVTELLDGLTVAIPNSQR